MSSDGNDPFSSLTPKSFNGGNFFQNFFSDALNYGLQATTGGTASFNGKGFVTGSSIDLPVAGLKEVTGAAAAEDANKQALAQYEDTKNNAAAARVEAQNQLARDQVRQSNAAQTARSNSIPTPVNKAQAASSISLGANERDFLGI